MKALTIKQPWLWAITDSTKRIENRTWRPPFHLIGQRIALHSSARVEQGEYIACCNISMDSLPPASKLPIGCIIATAIIHGYVVTNEHGAVIEQSRKTESYDPRADPWFFGPVGWWLTSVQKLAQPLPCKGALGMWNVPEEYLPLLEAA